MTDRRLVPLSALSTLTRRPTRLHVRTPPESPEESRNGPAAGEDSRPGWVSTARSRRKWAPWPGTSRPVTGWAAEPGVVRLPGGALVRGRGRGAVPRPADFTLVLADGPLPTWPHRRVRWRDFWVPADTLDPLHEVRRWALAGERVEVACRGEWAGRGRRSPRSPSSTA